MSKKLIKRPQVAQKLGICTKTVTKLVREGVLPRPVSLPGLNLYLWDEAEIDALVDDLIETRDAEAA